MAGRDAARTVESDRHLRLPRAWLGGLLVGLWLVGPAEALSEFTHEPLEPAPDTEEVIERAPLPPPPDFTVPLPDPIRPLFDVEDTRFGEPEIKDLPLPEVFYDPALLPEPVRAMRDALMEVARAGEIEGLRPLIAEGSDATQLSLGPAAEDPVAYLRSISGDPEGHEILAILYEVLAAGFVRLQNGDEEDIYVWPYFYVMPLEELDARQRVELFKLVTAGDYEDMRAYGGYLFYRAGITADGHWTFFIAGH
ncbi:hypothetical protein GRZ55_07515 [Chelativorans sp. ZYF759]|uniref:hypothetical protein n=1 Tax=Chelativorans sp. ZYF759 TaxID=2692213 RepID=UPI00145F13BB|nr:hypothetical protein [Chelativorans sp. ZYF759]NMG39085.1 hypothetical protein [Chelativorans sp. ZYF759]